MDKELFGDVISKYTDGEAVEDGFLVALDRRDRVTRPVFDWLCSVLPDGPRPPDHWPVEIMRWFGDKSPEMRTAALVRGLIGTHGKRAREVYEKNLGGGIWQAYATIGHGQLLSLDAPLLEPSPREGPEWGRRLWLLPNELGGLTLMFPEDY